MKTSILIDAISSDGKKVKKTVTNINPDKKNDTLKTFALMVNNLSNDSFVDANRVNVQSLDEAADKPPPYHSEPSQIQRITDEDKGVSCLGFFFDTDYNSRTYSNSSNPKYFTATRTVGDRDCLLLQGYEEGDPDFDLYIFFPESKTTRDYLWTINVSTHSKE